MKPIKWMLSLLLMTLLLASCGGQSTSPEAPTEEEEDGSASVEPQPEEEESGPLQVALERYREIISQADTYEYGDSEATGNYRYALVPMEAGAAVPALLLEQEDAFGIGDVRVFQYDSNTDTVLQPTGILQQDVAVTGGFRGFIGIAGDGKGLLNPTYFSGTGVGSIVRGSLENGELRLDTIWSGFFFQNDEYHDIVNTLPIDWYDIADLTPLDGWTPEDLGSGPLAAEERIVFTGVANTFTYEQTVELQGIPDPNESRWTDKSEIFHLIVLDEPQPMMLPGVENSFHEREVKMLVVSDWLTEWDGQHLTFAIDPNGAEWPSDTRLPVGEPWCGDVLILGPA